MSAYFDADYFDGTYFLTDTDAAPPEGSGGRKGVVPPRRNSPQPVIDAPDDDAFWLLFSD